ncbi:hypothetical protein A2U01_0111853, partial [Trifolium medium]|nr:hypothetical protein [Trifolium medium]
GDVARRSDQFTDLRYCSPVLAR